MAEFIAQITDGDEIGRGADGRAHTADRGRIGDAERQGRSEEFRTDALAFDLLGDAQGNRDHHQCGGGIGDPHRQQRRGEHETADQGCRVTTEFGDNIQCDTGVEIPFLDRQRDDEPAQQ